MLDDNAYGLSRRRVTLSTSGLVPAIDRLRDDCPVALAVSLHAPQRRAARPARADQPQVPARRSCSPPAVRYLERAPRDFVTFEYVMLDGVNDAPTQARELAALVRDVPCKFNLIPFNPFPGAEFRTSPRARILAFQQIADGRRPRDDDPQDARRGHRRRLRPARRAGAGPHQAAHPDPRAPRRDAGALIPPARDTTMMPLLRTRRRSPPLVAARRARRLRARRRPSSAARRAARSPTAAAASSRRKRARRIARSSMPSSPPGYYERGQMDVALEELNEAVKLDPDNPQHLQLLRPRLRDAGREREGASRISSARSQLAPQTPTSGTTGAGTCARNGRPRESIPEFEHGAAQPAVQDARDRADQRRALQRRVRRHRERRGVLQARAGAIARTTRRPRTASRCSRTATARCDEARG